MDIRNRHRIIYLVGLIILNILQVAISQAVFSASTSPADSNRSIQYNYRGQFAGAVNALIIDSTLVLTNTSSTTGPEVGSKVYHESIASRGFIKHMDAFGSNVDQPFLGNRSIATITSYCNSTSTPIQPGLSTTYTGNTARAVIAGNNFTQRKRTGIVSTAATNSSAYVLTTNPFCYVSPSAGLGGFFFSIGFGISDATFQDSTRLAVGMVTTFPSASSDPSNTVNCIMIGSDALDTLIYLMQNDGSGTCTKTSLGSSFRKTDSNTTWYRLSLYNPQGSGVVYYEVLNCLNNVSATGSVNSNLPTSTTLLGFIAWRNTGLISTAVGIDFNNMYIETEY